MDGAAVDTPLPTTHRSLMGSNTQVLAHGCDGETMALLSPVSVMFAFVILPDLDERSGVRAHPEVHAHASIASGQEWSSAAGTNASTAVSAFACGLKVM